MGYIKTTITERTSPSGEKKLYANIVKYSNIGNDQLIQYMLENSNVSRATAVGAVFGVRSCVENFLLNGHTILIPGLGRFSLNVKSKAQDSAKKVKPNTFKKLHIRFSPAKEIKASAKSAKFLGILKGDDTLDVVL